LRAKHYVYRVARFEAVTVPPKVQNKSTPNPCNPKAVVVYASNGTAVTRNLAPIFQIAEGIQIKQVRQKLVAGSQRKITVFNSALLDLPLLGELQLQASGIWTWDEDERDAQVTFDTFYFQATKLFGLENWCFPELKIPVWEFLRKQALWTTSYLDTELRIGRGATGNLFVFRYELSEKIT
jgi:PAP_fibrillin